MFSVEPSQSRPPVSLIYICLSGWDKNAGNPDVTSGTIGPKESMREIRDSFEDLM
jgi:hypothetical protein